MFRTITLLFCVFHLTFCKNSSLKPEQNKTRALVTTTPSATELVAALGQEHFLVGVDKYSTYPQITKDLPKIGDFMSPNVEAIAKLKPSLVILDTTQIDAKRMLTTLGIETLALSMLSIKDVKAGLRELGQKLETNEKADQAISQIENAMRSPKQSHNSAKLIRALVVIDRAKGKPTSMVGAGPKSYFDELLGAVKFINVLGDSHVDYPNVSLETAIKKNPDLIIDVSMGGKDFKEDWQSIPQFASTQVASFDEPYFLSPSPRVYLAFNALNKLRSGLQ